MNHTMQIRLLGGGSVGMVLILAVALFLSFFNLQEKEQQLFAHHQESKKQEDEKNKEVLDHVTRQVVASAISILDNEHPEKKVAALKKDLNQAEEKRIALMKALAAKDKLIQTKETDLKDLLAVKTNMTQLKQQLDKMLEGKNMANKKLEEQVTWLKVELVLAQDSLTAARKLADAAKQEAQNLRDRLKKLEKANLEQKPGVQGTRSVNRFTKGGNGAGSANWLHPEGELFGIYSLNNDQLTLTFSRGKERPTEFTPKTGDWSSYELKRVK